MNLRAISDSEQTNSREATQAVLLDITVGIRAEYRSINRYTEIKRGQENK